MFCLAGGLAPTSRIVWVKELSCRSVRVESAYHRGKAHDFYQKNGFEKDAHVFYRDLGTQ